MSVINTKFAGPSLHTGHQERAGFTVSIGILKRRTKRMREHHKRGDSVLYFTNNDIRKEQVYRL